MAIRWWADLLNTGHPPRNLWDLPAIVADEIREIAPIIHPPEQVKITR